MTENHFKWPVGNVIFFFLFTLLRNPEPCCTLGIAKASSSNDISRTLSVSCFVFWGVFLLFFSNRHDLLQAGWSKIATKHIRSLDVGYSDIAVSSVYLVEEITGSAYGLDFPCTWDCLPRTGMES